MKINFLAMEIANNIRAAIDTTIEMAKEFARDFRMPYVPERVVVVLPGWGDGNFCKPYCSKE